MKSAIKNFLLNLEFGEVKMHKNMAIVPIFTPIEMEYLTLGEAIEDNLIEITEVGPGAIPQLKVVNHANLPVLILNGEELIGIKQNRILNTSILVKENSEVIVPVSCTERGRWKELSEKASDFAIATPKLRMRKLSSVTKSLKESRTFKADQIIVWSGVEGVLASGGVASPTFAMSDAFKAKNDEIDEYLITFECLPNQKGLLVFIDGEIVGFEALSSEAAYRKLHGKFIKSYALEALLRGKEWYRISDKDVESKAVEFFKHVLICKEEKYKSVAQV
ncbi:hypothetical protein DRO97_05175 [Archaeoglobales archaeon]|nr:MAG: hypothetical protein DRO97_05175 [Archaeoglobales archaeon]